MPPPGEGPGWGMACKGKESCHAFCGHFTRGVGADPLAALPCGLTLRPWTRREGRWRYKLSTNVGLKLMRRRGACSWKNSSTRWRPSRCHGQDNRGWWRTHSKECQLGGRLLGWVMPRLSRLAQSWGKQHSARLRPLSSCGCGLGPAEAWKQVVDATRRVGGGAVRFSQTPRGRQEIGSREDRPSSDSTHKCPGEGGNARLWTRPTCGPGLGTQREVSGTQRLSYRTWLGCPARSMTSSPSVGRNACCDLPWPLPTLLSIALAPWLKRAAKT